MTGAVTWEVLAWVIGIIAAAGITVAGFLFWVWRILQAAKAEQAKELSERDLQIEAVHGRVGQVEANFNEFRVHAAENFATKDGMTHAIGRVEAAVERLTTLVHDTVERLTDRLDRMLEARERDQKRDNK
jgi:hypothetical protein